MVSQTRGKRRLRFKIARAKLQSLKSKGKITIALTFGCSYLKDRLSIRIFSEEKNMDLPSYESESFKRQLAVPFYMEIIILM